MKELVNLKNNIQTIKITLKAVYIKKLNHNYPSIIIHKHFINYLTKIKESDQIADNNHYKTDFLAIKNIRNKIQLS